jgi:hypothetical protein
MEILTIVIQVTLTASAVTLALLSMYSIWHS